MPSGKEYRVLEVPEELKTGRGYGEVLVMPKCNEQWTDEECPRPATCAEYHWGQFGHKILIPFCDECYETMMKERTNPQGWFMFGSGDDKGFEAYA